MFFPWTEKKSFVFYATSVPDTKRNTFLTRHFDTHAGGLGT